MHSVNKLLLLFGAPVTAFLAPSPSWLSLQHSRSRIGLHQRSNDGLEELHYDKDGTLEECKCQGKKYSEKLSRRRVLQGAATAGATLFQLTQTAHAYPQEEFRGDVDQDVGILDSTRKKVALRTSSSNVPNRYERPAQKITSNNTLAEESSTTTPSMCECPTYMTSEQRRIAVFERVAPSVVFIDTFSMARDSFSTNIMEVPLGAGSGFVWDDRGHIVTNYHVVRNARSAQVAVLTRVFPDEGESGTDNPLSRRSRQQQTQTPKTPQDDDTTEYIRNVYKARTVGIDPDKDIAVLKIDAPVFDLIPISVGESAKLKTGQEALAIGNPYGLDHTLTVGVVSGTGREVRSPSGRPISNVIQSDAAINPGNSGGPLLDSSGKLIGMNTAIYSPSGGSAGIGFAIPVDTLKFIVETLIRDGRIVRPVIGISYLESKQAKALGITKGVLILDVPPSSPAYKAGLRGTRRTESGLIELGDIIRKIDNRPIDTEADLFEALEDYKPGDKVKITISRVDLAPSSPLTTEDANSQTRLKMKDVTVTTELKGSQDAAPVNRIFIE